MKYIAPFIFLLLNSSLYSVDPDEEMLFDDSVEMEQERKSKPPLQPSLPPQLDNTFMPAIRPIIQPKRPIDTAEVPPFNLPSKELYPLSNGDGQNTVRLRERRIRATLKIAEGAKELKKVEKKEEERQRKKDENRKQTLRKELVQRMPPKAKSESDLRKKIRKRSVSFLNKLTLRRKKSSSKEEDSPVAGGERRWHSVEEEEAFEEELMQRLGKRMAGELEQRLGSSTASIPIPSRTSSLFSFFPSDGDDEEDDLEWQTSAFSVQENLEKDFFQPHTWPPDNQ